MLRFPEILDKQEVFSMANQDVLSSDWRQMRNRLKQRWHCLTDEDLALIAGSRDMLVSILCDKYAYPEQQVREEVAQFLKQVAP